MKTAYQAATESLWRNMHAAKRGDVDAALRVVRAAMCPTYPPRLRAFVANHLAGLGLEMPQ